MREISSSDNKLIRQAASLGEKKHRDALGLYLIEGPNFIRDALTFGGRLRFIFIRAGATSAEITAIREAAEEKGLAVYELAGMAFEKICSTQTSQGIIAVAEKRVWTEKEFFENEGSDLLVLDRVQDPGNLGTMLRSAEALGFGGVLLLKGCTDLYGPKLVRAAAGSLFRMPVYFADSPAEAVRLLEKHHKTMYATVMTGGIACYDADISKDAAIVIGNEGSGVCAELLEKSRKLTIPMDGDIESLNAGLAAGIVMYEAFRQKRKTF
ncbi:MAG: RNA methyltransferase [Firmicutes bacterium]|nr:RNA methyltransferase [Bacillota bacterium]